MQTMVMLDPRQQTLSRLQRLSASQAELLRSLEESGLLGTGGIADLIGELVGDRFRHGNAYLQFARQLDPDDPLSQPHVISRGYYAMYHMGRAAVLHHQRADVDGHDRLPAALSRIVGDEMGVRLGRWRDVRNAIEYSPYAPSNMRELAMQCLREAEELREACRRFLEERGVVV